MSQSTNTEYNQASNQAASQTHAVDCWWKIAALVVVASLLIRVDLGDTFSKVESLIQTVFNSVVESGSQDADSTATPLVNDCEVNGAATQLHPDSNDCVYANSQLDYLIRWEECH